MKKKYPKRKSIDQVNKKIDKNENKTIENKYKKLFEIIGDK